MRDKEVYDLCTGYFLDFIRLVCFAKCTGDEAIAGVGKCGFAVFFEKCFNLRYISVAFLEDGLCALHLFDARFYFVVFFQKFDGTRCNDE